MADGFLRYRISRLGLQAKIILVLLAVIVPVFLVVGLAIRQISTPILEQEMRAMGLHASTSLAQEIVDKKLLLAGKEAQLEQRALNTFFLQPNVVRVDVWRIGDDHKATMVLSTDDTPTTTAVPDLNLVHLQSKKIEEKDGPGYWEVWAPIKPKKGLSLGFVRMEVSLKSTQGLARAVGRLLVIAGAVTLFLLMVGLSYFLQKTVQNDRLLRKVEGENEYLSSQLREAERQLMIKEKLAVMGQLTATFAHEIGTPLNAIGGHLQLMQSELEVENCHEPKLRRLAIVGDQLNKIESIVKGFLQSTSKPLSQSQLMDVNSVLDKTLGIVAPRLNSLGVRVERSLERELAPVRAAPLDVEQVLLNLLNNSLDSLQAKQATERGFFSAKVEVFSRAKSLDGIDFVEVGVLDTGHGISKRHLNRVFEPFFTTKAAGEGTGLGLSICREIAEKYNGRLEVESREGAWTRVTLRLPYEVNV